MGWGFYFSNIAGSLESLIIQEFVSVIFDVKSSGMIFLEISLYNSVMFFGELDF